MSDDEPTYPIEHLLAHARALQLPPRSSAAAVHARLLEARAVYGETAPETVAAAQELARALSRELEQQGLSLDDDPPGEGLGDWFDD